MDRPAEWRERSPSVPGGLVIFEQAEFGDGINIVKGDLPSEISEDDLDKVLRQFLSKQAQDFHLISDKPVEVSGHHVYRMVYTATLEKRKLFFTQVSFIVGEKTSYTITIAGLPERQKELEPIIDHVLKTFKLEDDGKYEKYDDPAGRFHMDHPADWKELSDRAAGVLVAFRQMEFGDGVNVVKTELPQEMSEDDLDKALKQLLSKQLPDFHLISDEAAVVSGHHVYRMVYTGAPRKRKLFFTQVSLVIEGKIKYTITIGALPERQKEIEPIIDHVLTSFKLEEKRKQQMNMQPSIEIWLVPM